MKRLILTGIAVLLSTFTLWAQIGSEPVTPTGQTVSIAARPHRHHNKHARRHHPHTGINARR
jgi:hypothetical protein